jgi:HK97 family phage portal protein
MGIMTWIDRAMGFPVETKSDSNLTIYDLVDRSPADIRRDIANGVTYAGIGGLHVSTVFACARVIAEGLAQIPCLLQRRSATGGYENATDHPLFNLLNRAPNDYMTSFEFREWIGFQLALTGNAFVLINRGIRNRPVELIPLPSGSVTLNTGTEGIVTYNLKNRTYTKARIWHIKGASLDTCTGLDPRAVAARAIGLASDLESFGSQLFRNGSAPSGVLTTDQNLSAEQQIALSAAWNAQQAGVQNAHKTAVLGNGLEFQKIQTNANEAQFIESRRYQTEEICRVMRVDPIMIGQNIGSASYSSIEQRFLAHTTHTLSPYYQRFEQSAEATFLTDEEVAAGYRVHLDSRSLMKGNATDRATYLTTMISAGIMTRNEGREFEGLDRVNDESADTLTPAANLFGTVAPTPTPKA